MVWLSELTMRERERVEWSLVPSMRETGPEGHYIVNHQNTS